jgi:hypothetical protein
VRQTQLGRVQRSRRNVVAAVGVRLVEVPDAPSRGEVRIRIPSRQCCVRQSCCKQCVNQCYVWQCCVWQCCSWQSGSWHCCGWRPSWRHRSSRHRGWRHSSRRQRVALGKTHPSGDVESLHAPTCSSLPGWRADMAIGQLSTTNAMAECMTTGLTDQVGSDSGSRVTLSGTRSSRGIPASRKDPL